VTRYMRILGKCRAINGVREDVRDASRHAVSRLLFVTLGVTVQR
jgi:hypothetical protein